MSQSFQALKQQRAQNYWRTPFAWSILP